MKKLNQKVAGIVAALSFAQVVNAHPAELTFRVKTTDLGDAAKVLSKEGYSMKMIANEGNEIVIKASAQSQLDEIIGEGNFYAFPEIVNYVTAGRCPPKAI